MAYKKCQQEYYIKHIKEYLLEINTTLKVLHFNGLLIDLKHESIGYSVQFWFRVNEQKPYTLHFREHFSNLEQVYIYLKGLLQGLTTSEYFLTMMKLEISHKIMKN